MRSALVSALTLLCLGSPAWAQEKPQAFVGARIIPISGPEIPNGVLVVHRGRIVAVGPQSSTAIPAGADRHDVAGKVMMPGLVDTHSHMGGGSGGDSSSPIQPDVRIVDSINPRDTGFKRAQAGGVTTLNVMPGSGLLSSGQTLYLKSKNGEIVDDIAIIDAQGNYAGGLKMANGTNSIRATPPAPGSRAKSAALVRTQFVKAQEYRDKVRRAGGDAEKLPPRDLALETLVEVLDGKRIVHFHTHRHDDILTVLRLSKEFGFKPVLHHLSDGWKVADEIAAAGLGCSVIVIDSPGGKLEAMDASLETGAILEKAGALVGFHTDDYITDSRLFFRSAALAVRAGMSRGKALEALTLAGAKMLGLDGRVGSLAPGKDADFIVLSGDPLSVYTKVIETYIEGVKVFDRNDEKDRKYAVGGYGVSRGQVVHLDEWGEEGRR